MYGTLSIDAELPSPYAVKKNQETAEISHEEIQRLTKLGHTECLTFFNQAHTALRTQAHEVIVFMLTEKNRIQHDSIPYAYPVAYALKGASMTNADLRYLVDTVREACRNRNIPLLCEVYDGQWQNFITTSRDGKHLTKLHARNSWNRISALTKDKVLEEMYNASAVQTWDLDLVASHRWLNPNESLELTNICIWKKYTGSLFAESCGGSNFEEPVIARFVSVTENTCPDLFPLEVEDTQAAAVEQINEEHAYYSKRKVIQSQRDSSVNENTEDEMAETLSKTKHVKDLVVSVTHGKKKKCIGLQSGEQDLLFLLDKDLVTEILKTEDENDNSRYTEGELLSSVVLDPRCELLFDIHAHLIYNNKQKWVNKTPADFYPSLLTSGEALMSECSCRIENNMQCNRTPYKTKLVQIWNSEICYCKHNCLSIWGHCNST